MKLDPQALWLEELERSGAFTNYVFEHVKPHLGGSVLEVACGRGTYTRLLAKSAQRVVAVDIDESFVAEARAGTSSLGNVEIRCADVTAENYEEEFDTIVMLDILEHISDDRALLRKLARALRPSGRIVAKVPAFQSLFGAVDHAAGHCRRYSRDDLAKSLVECGFRSPDIWYFNAASIPGWWLNGIVLRRANPPATQLSLFGRLMPFVRTIDRLSRPWLGLSLFAVAERHTST